MASITNQAVEKAFLFTRPTRARLFFTRPTHRLLRNRLPGRAYVK
jgi:hypothetical protein